MIFIPEINPVALSIGPLAIRWYGLMYIFGFAAAMILGWRRALQQRSLIKLNQFQDVIFYSLVGLIAGARIGYTFFYNWDYFINHPLEIFAVWNGGMSFHGGLIGVFCAVLLYSWRQGLHPLDIGDFLVPLAPPGLFTGRIGNFINAELWGRPSDVPWAMVFPTYAAGGIPRHPSQLYEALLEGVVLFLVLWTFSARPKPRGSVTGLFLLLYGLFRFMVEFFREPDIQLGFVAINWLTMGQILSLPMIIIGIWLLVSSDRVSRMPQAMP